MGLFDNLIKKGKNLIDQIKNKKIMPIDQVQNNKTVPNEEDDNIFGDEVIQKYYDVIYGMIKSVGNDYLKDIKINLITKAYIEKQLNESCDEEKMKKALDLFNLSQSGIYSQHYNDKKAIFLRNYNEDLKETNNYLDNNFDIINLCFKDEYILIEKEYEEILETIKNKPQASHFGQGINKKIYKKYQDTLGKAVTNLITLKIINNSLSSGNQVTQSAMINAIRTTYAFLIKQEAKDYQFANTLSIIAVRALHFEKNPNILTIETSEYRKLLLTHNYYKKDFGPFVEEGEISEKISLSFKYYNDEYAKGDWILNIMTRIGIQLEGYESIANILHLDNKIYNLICNLVWKDAIKKERTNDVGEDITSSQEVADIFTILNQYFVEIYGGPILS